LLVVTFATTARNFPRACSELPHGKRVKPQKSAEIQANTLKSLKVPKWRRVR
jgi:hypothetical protein